MAKQLGKGLEELFIDNSYLKEVSKEEKTIEVALNKIVPNPYQPRKFFDETSLNELADSIKEYGVVSPIILTYDGVKYILVAGERRYRASKIAGKTTIPAIVREYSDKSIMEIALLENIQRQDLTFLEIASSYKTIIERLSITQEEFAKRIGKSRAQITNMIGMLKLPSEVIEYINNNEIQMGHARALSKLNDDERICLLARKIIKEKLTVRDVEELCQEEPKKHEKVVIKKNNYNLFRDQVASCLETKVKISGNKITINFADESDLRRIIDIINKNK